MERTFESFCLTCLCFPLASHCPDLIIVGGQRRVLRSGEVQLAQKHKGILLPDGDPPQREGPSRFGVD